MKNTVCFSSQHPLQPEETGLKAIIRVFLGLHREQSGLFFYCKVQAILKTHYVLMKIVDVNYNRVIIVILG